MQFLQDLALPIFLKNIIIAGCAIVVGLLLVFIFKIVFKFFAKFWATFQINSILNRLTWPISIFIPLLLLNGSLSLMQIREPYQTQLDKILEIALTITFSLILVRIVKVFEDFVTISLYLIRKTTLKSEKYAHNYSLLENL